MEQDKSGAAAVAAENVQAPPARRPSPTMERDYRIALTKIGLAIGFGIPFAAGLIFRAARILGWSFGLSGGSSGGGVAALAVELAVVAGLLGLVLKYELRPLGSIGLRMPSRADLKLGFTVGDGIVTAIVAAALIYIFLIPDGRSVPSIVALMAPAELASVIRAPFLLLMAIAIAAAAAEEIAARGYAIERLSVIVGNRALAGGVAVILALTARLPLWGFAYLLLMVPAEIALTAVYLKFRKLAPNIFARALVNVLIAITVWVCPSPHDPRAWPSYRASSNSQSDNDAISSLNQAFKSTDSKLLPYLQRGQADINKGDYTDAIGEMTKVIQLNPKDPVWMADRAALYAQSGQRDKAIADYTELIGRDSKSSQLYRFRGNNYALLGDADRALADHNMALKLDPHNSFNYSARSGDYYLKKEYSLALKDIDKAIELAPKYAPFVQHRAEIYHADGDYAKAIADYSGLIAMDPNNPAGYGLRAQEYVFDGNYKRAVADLDQAERLQGPSADMYLIRANIEIQAQDWQGAHNDLVRLAQTPAAVEASNADWAAWRLATNPHPELRDGQAAVILATRANQATGWRNPAYLQTLAAAYAEAGDFFDAGKYQALAVSGTPNPDSVAPLQQQLRDYESGRPYREDEPVSSGGPSYSYRTVRILGGVVVILAILGILTLFYVIIRFLFRLIRAGAGFNSRGARSERTPGDGPYWT